MTLSDVLPIAEYLRDLLSVACEECEIAGSVRRRKPEVHDLELVLLPHRDRDMFDELIETYSVLDKMIASLVADQILAWDEQVKRNGAKLKRLINGKSGLVVELYIADEKNFGNLLAIRTGCWEFSRGLVTSRVQGGQMPSGMRQIDGYLQRGGEIVPCRAEREYFDALGLRWYEPWERTPELAAKLWRDA